MEKGSTEGLLKGQEPSCSQMGRTGHGGGWLTYMQSPAGPGRFGLVGLRRAWTTRFTPAGSWDKMAGLAGGPPKLVPPALLAPG